MPKKETTTNKSKAHTKQHVEAEDMITAEETTMTLEEQAQEYLAGWKRAQADYQNLKKQSVQEKEMLATYVKSQVLTDFFPIIDNFNTALEHIPEDMQSASWVQGLMYVQQQINHTFEGLGVTKIESVGTTFDVTKHEAIEKQPSEEHASNTVIKELRSGYCLGDVVIAPAKVVVAE